MGELCLSLWAGWVIRTFSEGWICLVQGTVTAVFFVILTGEQGPERGEVAKNRSQQEPPKGTNRTELVGPDVFV